MRLLSLIIILLVLVQCKDVSTKDRLNYITSNFSSKNSIHFTKMLPAINQPYIVGELGDTTLSNKNIWKLTTKDVSNRCKTFELLIDTINKFSLELTENQIGNFNDTTNCKVFDYWGRNKNKKALFKGLGVYIINPDTINHVLSFQDNSPIIIYEALDSLGNWRPIEWWNYTYFCGNSYYGLTAEPKSYLFTKVIQHSGDYKTKLRLKHKNFETINYSNVISGSINYSLFDNTPALQNIKKRYSIHTTKDTLDELKTMFLN